MPEVLLAYGMWLVRGLLNDQVDECVFVSLEAYQGLGDLVAVGCELVLVHLLNFLYCEESHLLVHYPGVEQEQCLQRLQTLPLVNDWVGLGYFVGIQPINRVEVVNEFAGLVLVELIVLFQDLFLLHCQFKHSQRVVVQDLVQLWDVLLLVNTLSALLWLW